MEAIVARRARIVVDHDAHICDGNREEQQRQRALAPLHRLSSEEVASTCLHHRQEAGRENKAREAKQASESE